MFLVRQFLSVVSVCGLSSGLCNGECSSRTNSESHVQLWFSVDNGVSDAGEALSRLNAFMTLLRN